MENYIGSRLFREEKEEKSENLRRVDFVLLYFAAKWSGPCRNAFPHIKQLYTEANQAGQVLEIVFISCDRSKEEFKDHIQEMPWCYIAYKDQGLRTIITRHYEVNAIPTMILINKWGVSLSNTILADIALMPTENCLTAWRELVDGRSTTQSAN
jgi:thiol-disulfide isomerase/thioredoxin